MQPFIRVCDVYKNFSKNGALFYGLKEVSLQIDKGEIFGIIGQSGAGKSTLLRCMSSLEKPTSGKIWFGEEEITSFNTAALRSFRKKIGMIFQHFHLLSSRTVAQNIALPMELASIDKEEIEKKVDELLFLVGLTEKKDAYPAVLSGGEKQRVGIARALALGPQVLFCDEATSALDPKMTKEILELLKELNKKLSLTIVLITHQMEVIKQICHKVAVIDKGQIVEMANVSTLFSEPKHPITKHMLLSGTHLLPDEVIKKGGPDKDFLRLYFKGSSAKEPIISKMLKSCDVSVNILLGWIDAVEDTTVGTLTVEVAGSAESRRRALQFLKDNDIRFEVLNNELK